MTGVTDFIYSNLTKILLGMSIFTFSCTNGSNLSFNLNNGGGNPFPPGFGAGNGIFTITQILPSNQNANILVDVIGDGSGSIGNFCGISSQGFPQAPPSTTCQCIYTYTNPTNQNVETVPSPVVYSEGEKLLCRYDVLPAGVVDAELRIKFIPQNAVTNKLTFATDGAASVFNTTDPKNFVKAQRYQCRDHIVVPYMFDNAIYDPFQSEDQRLSYGLNFYSTDFGSALKSLQFASAANPGPFSRIECSIRPENYNPTNPLDWENPLIFSQAPSSIDGSQTIFPPTAASDRSTFYLSTKKTSVFRIPFNTVGAPGLVTAEGTTLPPLGFAAAPIPSGNNEVCPNVPIPAGFKWVKVWAFSGNLAAREAVLKTSEVNTNNAVACNPGEWLENPIVTENDDPDSIFADCAQPNTAGVSKQQPLPDDISELGFRYFANAGVTALVNNIVNGNAIIADQFRAVRIPTPLGLPLSATPPLASRVFDIGNQNQSGQVCVRYVNDAAGGVVNPNFRAGTDLWERVGDEIRTIPFGLGQTTFLDPQTQPNTALVASPRSNISTQSDLLALDNGEARLDFVFTVSPVSISKSQMETQGNDVEEFYPWGFKNFSDCEVFNPLNNTECLAKRNTEKATFYGLFTKEITLAPNPGSEDRFPLCALQPVSQ